MLGLTGKQRRYLRGLGHHIDPVVMVGQRGVTEAVITKTNEELLNHELIKVRVGGGTAEKPKALGAALSEACVAELVQVIGRTFLLYRPREKKPEIELPAAADDGK